MQSPPPPMSSGLHSVSGCRVFTQKCLQKEPEQRSLKDWIPYLVSRGCLPCRLSFCSCENGKHLENKNLPVFTAKNVLS